MTPKAGNCGYAAVIVSSLLVLSAVVSPATAQGTLQPAPPLPPGSGGTGGGGTAPVETCRGIHDVSYVNPYAPVTTIDDNHTTIEKAICHTRPGGKVIVTRRRDLPYQEQIYIDKPGITIEAADADAGGMVQIAPPAGYCAAIVPAIRSAKDHFSTNKTYMRGIILTAPQASDESYCVYVDNGELILENSRIEMGASDKVAIAVGTTGSLKFSGRDYTEHGLFRLPGNTAGIGVAAFRSPAISLERIRVQGFDLAVDSGAESNNFAGVMFFDNNTALRVTDDAITQAYAPSLKVTGGGFARNVDAISLHAGAIMAEEDLLLLQSQAAFRGEVLIGGENEGDGVTFVQNDRGLTFVGAYPATPVTIANSEFKQNAVHGVSFPSPRFSQVGFIDTSFSGGGAAIKIDGPLDGSVRITGKSKLSGGDGISIDDGDGEFVASLTSTGALNPAIRFGAGFFGGSNKPEVSIAGKMKPTAVAIDPAASFCKPKLNDSKSRDAFTARLQGLRIFIADIQIADYFAKRPPEMKESELREAVNTLCR